MFGETPKDNPLGDIFGSSDKSKTTTTATATTTSSTEQQQHRSHHRFCFFNFNVQ